MMQLHNETMAQIRELEAAGYTVVFEWECRFEKRVREDPLVAGIMRELRAVPPLNPRMALSGGR